jgi:ribonuclease Z
MKKLILTLFIALIVVIGYSQRGPISVALLERGLDSLMGVNMIADLEDGLHVVLCGAGSPLPDPNRSGPCVAVVAGSTVLVIDAGTGAGRNLGTMQLPVGEIASVLLTHFHSDHIDGLGELAMMRWVNTANTSPLPVIGPSGVGKVVNGFNLAYSQDAVYRNDHHSDAVAPLSGTGMTAKEVKTPVDGESITVFEKDGLVVTMFSVDHAPVSPAVGYRFDYKGRSLLISGDTDKSSNLQDMAKGIDLLVHEALAPQLVGLMNKTADKKGMSILKKITHDILDYHASPIEVAEIAEAVGAGHLLYYHIVPALPIFGLEAAFVEGVSDIYKGPVTVGVDGTTISLPAGSDDIVLH